MNQTFLSEDKTLRRKKSMPEKWFHAKSRWNWSGNSQAFFASLCDGFTLNLCSGGSPFGDVKLDICNSPDLKADASCREHRLPFRDSVFDSVFVDPPFRADDYPEGCPRIHYGNLKRELTRILKPHGKVVFLQYYPVEFVNQGFETADVFVHKRMFRGSNGGLMEISEMPVICTVSKRDGFIPLEAVESQP